MHQVVYYFGDDLDTGMALFEYKRPEYKITPVDQILTDPKYQRWLSENRVDGAQFHPFNYIRYRLGDSGPVVIVDRETYSPKWKSGLLEDYEIETVMCINEKGQISQLELMHHHTDTNKWDWWVVGGRWNASFLLKPGGARINHAPDAHRFGLDPVITDMIKKHELVIAKYEDSKVFEDGVNCALWGDIDHARMYEILRDKRLQKLLGIRNKVKESQRLMHLSYEDMLNRNTEGRQNLTHEERDAVMVLYRGQDSMTELNEWLKQNPFDREDVDIALSGNIQADADEYARACTIPYSFVYEGKWYSKDNFDKPVVDYLKMTYEERQANRKETTSRWHEFYQSFVLKIPNNTIVTCCDIHY